MSLDITSITLTFTGISPKARILLDRLGWHDHKNSKSDATICHYAFGVADLNPEKRRIFISGNVSDIFITQHEILSRIAWVVVKTIDYTPTVSWTNPDPFTFHIVFTD